MTLEHPQFEAFCSYFAQCDVSLTSGNTLQRGISAKFDDEKVKIWQLFRPIEKVSLIVDTWSATNHLANLGITIHWIDDMWNLHECVLIVEELHGSHEGPYMAKVLHEVMVDYNLMNKVRIFFNFCIFFVLNTCFPCFVQWYAVTADNASNNNTMAASLEKWLKGFRSRFTKKYFTPCVTHVLNLAMQCGLKELGNEESYSDSEDDDKHLEGLEAISQKPFGEILHRLRKLVIAINFSPKRIHHYKNLCNELEMPNKNILVEDIWTRWNSIYDMIEAAWEKKEVLKVTASNHLNINKAKFLIEDEKGSS